jgi:hypothetical protein
MTTRCFAAISGMFLLISLGACDTAPQPWDEKAASPPASGKARIYVYRNATVYDSTVWTAVSLNGTVVGNSAPGTVFYRDIASGTYRLEARSDKLYPGQVKTIALAPGATMFVEVEGQPFWGQTSWEWQGSTFTIAIVDPAIGRARISALTLTPG